MTLTTQQKKYIKKNVSKRSFEEIANNLKIDPKELKQELKKNWPKHKFEKYFSFEKSSSFQGSTIETFSFAAFFNQNRGAFILLAILVIGTFINSLNNQFVSDDIFGIVQNKQIGDFKKIFESLTLFLERFISFFVYNIGGLNPAYYRFVNIAFHLFSTYLIFIIITLTYKKNVALMTALIFAVHPAFSEAVVWISGAPYVRYTFFSLAFFLFYLLAEKNKRYYYFALFFFVLTALSSEKSLVILPIVILYEYFSKGTFASIPWKKLSPFLGLGVLWGLFYLSNLGSRESSLDAQSFGDGTQSNYYNPLEQIPTAIASYLGLIFWPSGLTLYHTEMTFSTGEYILMLTAFLTFGGITGYALKKNRQLAFWLLFFFISLLPTLTPLKISWVVAERYAYFGSIGIFAAIAMSIEWISRKKQWEIPVYSLFAILIIALSIRTIVRNTDWKNEDTLWFATAETSPSGQNIHNNLGDVYARRGDNEKAITEFKKAIEINPRYADALHNLANTYQTMGKVEEAKQYYQKALENHPNLWQAHQNLAIIYIGEKKLDLAEQQADKALQLNPNEPKLQEIIASIKTEKEKVFKQAQ